MRIPSFVLSQLCLEKKETRLIRRVVLKVLGFFEYEKKNVNSKNGNSLELIHVEEKEKSGKQKVRAFLITCTFVTKKKPQNFKKV